MPNALHELCATLGGKSEAKHSISPTSQTPGLVGTPLAGLVGTTPPAGLVGTTPTDLMRTTPPAGLVGTTPGTPAEAEDKRKNMT